MGGQGAGGQIEAEFQRFGDAGDARRRGAEMIDKPQMPRGGGWRQEAVLAVGAIKAWLHGDFGIEDRLGASISLLCGQVRIGQERIGAREVSALDELLDQGELLGAIV